MSFFGKGDVSGGNGVTTMMVYDHPFHVSTPDLMERCEKEKADTTEPGSPRLGAGK